MTGQSESETEVVAVDELRPPETKTIGPDKSIYQFVCSFGDCNAVFSRLFRLERHLRKHTKERPFVCNIDGCVRSFTCRSYLKKHQSRPHSDDNGNVSVGKPSKPRKQYICNECDPSKAFKSKFQLKLHNYQHSGEKPFPCDKCDKRFATKTKLKSHVKTHDGYPCGREGCDYKTCKWSELRKHIASEHKSFRCEVCSKSFANSNNLEVHKETVHLNPELKTNVCTHEGCDKAYSRKSNLLSHIRTKHEKQMFNCTVEGCESSFLHKKSLDKHLNNHLNPKKLKPKKLCPRKASKAAQLTGIELTRSETKQLMESDLMFRKEIEK